MTNTKHHLKNYRQNLSRQQGITFVGMLFVGAFIILIAITAMRIVPAYSEFMTVKKILKAMQQDPLNTMTPKEIKVAFDKRASIDYISVVSGEDLSIERTDSGATVVTIEYQVVKPLMGNVSVLMDFAARSDDK
jgi:hypothetical protein